MMLIVGSVPDRFFLCLTLNSSYQSFYIFHLVYYESLTNDITDKLYVKHAAGGRRNVKAALVSVHFCIMLQ